jgi:L-aminopeptidase/D-esterase-like protein
VPGSIVSVPGLLCGHFTDPRRPTGCTVVLAPDGAVAGVDVRGAAPGTRETELLSPLNSVEKIHAVLLAGGSAFGLDAAGGVMRWLEERGIGVQVGSARVPIVPAAILFDLFDGFTGDIAIRPDAAAGYAACDAACREAPAEGNVGAGAGAVVGKMFGIARAMKGGIGTASLSVGGITVGAIVAVNAVGDVIDPQSGRVVAGARTADGAALLGAVQAMLRGEATAQLKPVASTTLAIVATDAVLTKSQAGKLAQMSHDGLARAINPVHTASDGDTVFALSTGAAGRGCDLTLLGTMAAEATAAAILRAVLAADALPRLPCARDFAAPA